MKIDGLPIIVIDNNNNLCFRAYGSNDDFYDLCQVSIYWVCVYILLQITKTKMLHPTHKWLCNYQRLLRFFIGYIFPSF